MRVNFGEVFHQISKDKTMNGFVNIPADKTLWSPAWKTVTYKAYGRFKSILLPALTIVTKEENENKTNQLSRSSEIVELPKSILEKLSVILYHSCGEVDKSPNGERARRAQISVGMLYPVEAYLVISVDGGSTKKCYHYNVKNHSLEELWEVAGLEQDICYELFGQAWSINSLGALILTAIPSRSTSKYGENGYKYVYFEAGAIAQNLKKSAAQTGLTILISEDCQDNKIEKLLDIDGIQETVVLSMILTM